VEAISFWNSCCAINASSSLNEQHQQQTNTLFPITIVLDENIYRRANRLGNGKKLVWAIENGVVPRTFSKKGFGSKTGSNILVKRAKDEGKMTDTPHRWRFL
jgi:hypothetical protein